MDIKEIKKLKLLLEKQKCVYYKYDGLYTLKRILAIIYGSMATFSGKPFNQQTSKDFIDLADENIELGDFVILDREMIV
jgi:hypothetical protein